MPPKRKYEEPKAIMYGAAVPWLQVSIKEATYEPYNPVADLDINLSLRDPKLVAFIADDVVLEAAKVAYLLHHTLDIDGDLLSNALRSIGAGPDTPEHNSWVKKLSKKQTQWKSAILHRFLVMHVKEIIRKWHVAHAWKSFTALPQEERETIWMAEYDADPKGIIIAMMKPVIGVLDTANTFNCDLEDLEDQANMSAIRVMLRNKYIFGCEITYKNRIQYDWKDNCSREWAAYVDRDSFSNSIVPIASLPISSKTLEDRPVSQAKRQK